MSDMFLNFAGNRTKATDGIRIPVPRAQSQVYSRPDYLYPTHFETDCGSPSCPPLVPPNSLVTNYGQSFNNEGGCSPFTNFASTNATLYSVAQEAQASGSMQTFDDMEVKMEPMDDIFELNSIINSGSYVIPEDNLLDDVNFEDLLLPDDMETTPCLDPQHSSPAAMATVHPDEVLGFTSSKGHQHHIGHAFSSSMNVPVKTELAAQSDFLPSSFPPHGIGWWKDPFIAGDTGYQAAASSYKDNVVSSQLQQQQVRFSQPTVSPTFTEQTDAASSNLLYKCEPSSFSPLESTSALHDLLVNSPSTSTPHSVGASPQSNLSVSPQLFAAGAGCGGHMQQVPVGQSVPGPANFLTQNVMLSSRLSSSAPTNNFNIEKIWQRREMRHPLSSGSLVEEIGGSASSLSTGGGVLSPISHDLSIDDEIGIDSDDDSDDHYDSDSDNDSLKSEDTGSFGQSLRKERHFWQYNVQAKGPKGQRVNITRGQTNPHQLEEAKDPVFNSECAIQGIKHSGKARRGDGNDLTPSPRKLVSIGNELDKLNKKITDMTPVSELPNTVRCKSRKEKNKLASRACRLKKKAQHEANKIKLHGLEHEHKAYMSILQNARTQLIQKVLISNAEATSRQLHNEQSDQAQYQLTIQIDKLSKARMKQNIAGQTAEFVNKVIENCRSGNPHGGLDQLTHTFLRSSLSSPENY